MLIRTHLVISVFFILLLLDEVSNKFIFVAAVLIATFIPDLDSHSSKIGRKGISKVLTAFTKHRGIMHSFTFLFFLIFILFLILLEAGLGFFIGYSLHLVCDAFTKRGIVPFYPFKFRIRGFIRTGGAVEIVLFFMFLVGDIYFGVMKFLMYF